MENYKFWKREMEGGNERWGENDRALASEHDE